MCYNTLMGKKGCLAQLNILFIVFFQALCLTFSGCNINTGEGTYVVETGGEEVKETETLPKRDNTPKVLIPSKSGEVSGNEYVTVDTGNAKDGYIIVSYLGNSSKVKFRVTGSNLVTYTYDLNNEDACLPLSSGSGEYAVECFENIEGDMYATVFSDNVSFENVDEFGPFLYPNQYVDFDNSSQIVDQSSQLAADCTCDLEVVSNVFNFVADTVKYDYDEAENVQSGYLPDVDEVLTTGKGICFDYAALMTAMLRSQGIPTRMEIGYANDAYHAWISTYITDVGWVNGVIEFDGRNWTLMDPTFAANSGSSDLKDFIGDGENYTVKYIY